MEDTNILRPMSDEDIEKQGLSLADVWMLQTPSGKSTGPFSTQMLKEDSKGRPDFYEECKVYNLVTEEWKDFFVVPDFQRRKPKLVPAQNLIKNESFWLLQSGQKTGPFTFEQLRAKVDQNEVSLNQEISVDEGASWIKIYEHHAFDRRARAGREDLPFQPTVEVFEDADEVTSAKVLSLQKDKEDSRVISGLAFIGRGNDRGQRITVHKASESAEESSLGGANSSSSLPITLSKTFKMKMAAGFALVCLIAGGVAIKGQFSGPEARLGETKTKDSKRINNSDRSQRKRRPASAHRPKQNSAKPSNPKRYEAPQKREAYQHTARTAPSRGVERMAHKYEDFESLDIDDPKVREELTRELAGDYYDEQNREYDDYDSQGVYQDEYPEERSEIDQRQGDYYDEPPRQEAAPSKAAPDDYRYDDEYEDVPQEEPAYEEYGDFE